MALQTADWDRKGDVMAHPNEELARRGYAAFATGDMATLDEVFADDIVWHASGRSPMSGDFEGKEAVLAYFGRLAQETGGNFRIEIHDILANDEHVVALTTANAERQGKSLNNAKGVQVFHIRNGKVTESWFHSGDQYADDEFFS
jgi:ketosteroid isomerase-like protein